MITTGQQYTHHRQGGTITILEVTEDNVIIRDEATGWTGQGGHAGEFASLVQHGTFILITPAPAAKTPSLEAQLTEARTLLQNLINQGLGGGADHARLERRINALKTRIMRQTAENASVAASAGSLARELNISVLDLCRTLAKGAGPATRLSQRERAVLRAVYGN